MAKKETNSNQSGAKVAKSYFAGSAGQVLKTLLSESEENVIIVNTDLEIELFNEPFEKYYYKYFKKEVKTGDCILDYTLPERRRALQSLYERVFSGEVHESEIEISDTDGTPVIFKNKFKPIKSDDGKVTGAFIASIDVTKERLLERQLRDEHNALQNIHNQSVDMICTAQEGSFKTINRASEKILGYTPDEIIGKSYKEFIHPDDIDDTIQAAQNLYSKNQLVHFENRYRHKSGHWVPLIWSAKFNKQDGILYSIARDATVLRESSHKLLQSERRLKSAQKMAQLGYWEYNPKSEEHTWSSMYFELVGMSPESGKPSKKLLLDLIHPDDREKFNRQFSESVASGKPFDITHRLVIKGSRVKYVHQLAEFVAHPNEEMILQGTIQDVSLAERQRLEKELESSIVQSLHTHEDLAESLSSLLEKITDFTGHAAAEAWFVHRDENMLYRKSKWSSDSKYNPMFSAGNRSFDMGIGLPGVTAKTGELQFWDKLPSRNRFLRRNLAGDLSLNEGIGIPVFLNRKVIAVFTLFGERATIDKEFVGEVLNRLALQIGFDIQRKQTSDELKSFFKFSPQLICIVGTDGFYRKVNPEFTRLLGYSEKELLTKPFHLFVHPDDRGKSLATLEQNNTGYVTKGFENRYITKKGEVKWISWQSSELLEEEGLLFGFGTDITAIKEANIQLTKFRNIVEQTRDGIGVFSLHDESIYINQGFESVIGYTAEDIDNMGGPTKLYADKALAEEMFTAILSGDFWKGDMEIVARDGTVVDYHLSAGPVMDPQGNFVAVYGIHTDIRQRKIQERELKKALKEKQDILDSIGEGFFSMNDEQEITYWNYVAESLTGLLRSDVTGRKFDNVFPPGSDDSFTENLRKAIEKGKEFFAELMISHTRKWVQMAVYPSANETSVFFRDITESKIQTAEKERLLDVVDRSLNEVFIFDKESLKFRYINSGALKNIGYSLEEMQQVTPVHIKPAYDEESFRELIAPLVSGEEDKIIFETLHLRADGSHYPVEVHLQLMEYAEQSLFVAVILDITERKKQEEKLRKLNRQLNRRAQELALSNAELEQFAYVASHDLQEPLRMVTSFLDRLEQKYADELDDKAKQYIRFATDGARRMRITILDLLEFSRIDRHHDDQIKTVNMNLLLDEVEQMCESSISENDVEIIKSDLPEVDGWPEPLRQVFMNLISNAIKYRKPNEKPVVKIDFTEKEDNVVFSVADNGIGIESRYFEKIFLIFQRLHQRDEYPGTGIGLAICKKIIERHGGEVWLTSEYGTGTTFFVSLPKRDLHN